MPKIYFSCLFLIAVFALDLHAKERFNDGPYLIYQQNDLLQFDIKQNHLTITPYQGPYSIPEHFSIAKKDTYNNVEKWAAISDIHGQVSIFITLLKNNKVIDAHHNWQFGQGHLIITGDIFDRGDTVTEALWLIYKLEQQAEKAGGKVHYLLGNHEYMVLRGDERYLHPKYVSTLNVMQKDLKSLFSANTVLGQWLRSKATIIKLNQLVFLHGGIHQDFIDLNLSLEQANQHFRNSIGLTKKEMLNNPTHIALHATTGPIWYRGYFRDAQLQQTDIQSILKALDAQRIVVGHTSFEQLETRYNNKVLAIDSSIKNGIKGELLMWQNQQFIRADMQGQHSSFFVE
ncbi:hypothetical protein PULV_a2535 [Pseudoalteromonas ulvae UL12]|uniref:Metallophosphoesterase n=1 Tax=Pseudoalteromonas ulvae TaxID=107327 RepID=A0A2D0A0A6_PSEDV|nr:metallophosphoesterase [Pseudoalteromonas ulvae]MBE0364771.1 hypothetical protein [Pseudoalteromonas ulvae UL12]OUL56105.1 metallophosphoesterase [Pseudoalteromonas ulvae]